jgi:hypothetical protein
MFEPDLQILHVVLEGQLTAVAKRDGLWNLCLLRFLEHSPLSQNSAGCLPVCDLMVPSSFCLRETSLQKPDHSNAEFKSIFL